jgi:hypothetical protein
MGSRSSLLTYINTIHGTPLWLIVTKKVSYKLLHHVPSNVESYNTTPRLIVKIASTIEIVAFCKRYQ